MLVAKVTSRSIELRHAVAQVILSGRLSETILPDLIVTNLALCLHQGRYVLSMQVCEVVVAKVDQLEACVGQHVVD